MTQNDPKWPKSVEKALRASHCELEPPENGLLGNSHISSLEKLTGLGPRGGGANLFKKIDQKYSEIAKKSGLRSENKGSKNWKKVVFLV